MHTTLGRVRTSNVMRLAGSFSPTILVPRHTRHQSRPLFNPPAPPRQLPIPHNALLLPVRHFHLGFKNIFRPKDVDSSGMSDTQEEVAKAAILEKVMKGRQLTDLMLRCMFLNSNTFSLPLQCNRHYSGSCGYLVIFSAYPPIS